MAKLKLAWICRTWPTTPASNNSQSFCIRLVKRYMKASMSFTPFS